VRAGRVGGDGHSVPPPHSWGGVWRSRTEGKRREDWAGGTERPSQTATAQAPSPDPKPQGRTLPPDLRAPQQAVVERDRLRGDRRPAELPHDPLAPRLAHLPGQRGIGEELIDPGSQARGERVRAGRVVVDAVSRL